MAVIPTDAVGINIQTEGIVTKGINLSDIDSVFDSYRQTQMAIDTLKDKLGQLKPILTDLVKMEEGEAYVRDGYKAQIVINTPSRVLKTKAEVLTAVPKKYHYQILKDKKGSSYVKVALAPKENTVSVLVTEA